MAFPRLRRIRRRGRDEGAPPAGMPWSLYVPMALALFLLWNFRDLVVDYAAGRWPEPEPSYAGAWEGRITVEGEPRQPFLVRLCLRDPDTFEMIWIDAGFAFRAHVAGTWLREEETIRLRSESHTRPIPASPRTFGLTSSDEVLVRARLEGVGIAPMDPANPLNAMVMHLVRIREPSGGCRPPPRGMVTR